MGALPKSKSGPSPTSEADGQFAPFGLLQPTTNTSFGVTCCTQRVAPVSRSNATIESLVPCCGSVYILPVAAYTTRRFASTVGEDQMPAPDGPQRVVPLAFLPMGLESDEIV